VTFSAMGDVPYEQWENDQLAGGRGAGGVPRESEFVFTWETSRRIKKRCPADKPKL